MKPARVLHKITLYKEREIHPGVFYAEDGEGRGRLHDKVIFLGLAQPYQYDDPKQFKVHIHGRLCPGNDFIRFRYKSQQAANKALVFHALRLHKSQTPHR